MFLFHFKKKKPFLSSPLPKGMTDLHAHLLPAVDDGAKSEEDALALLDYLQGIGLEHLFLTPHVMADLKKNDRTFLRDRFERFRSVYQGPIELRLAAEYMLDEQFFRHLEQGLLAYDGQHVLVETSYLYAPPDLQGMIYEITLNGYTPVLAHPERYAYMEKQDYLMLKNRGCLFQMNLLSLSGFYGKGASLRCRELLEEELYDLIGSDIHNRRHKDAYAHLSLSAKEETAFQKLFERNHDLWTKHEFPGPTVDD